MSTSEVKLWLKGQILPVSEAKINVLSPTSQFGANVFEGIRGYWSGQQLYIFKLEEHIERLQQSIKLMRIQSNYTNQDFEDAILSVVRANKFKGDVAIRQTVFIDGFGNWASDGPVEMFVAPILKNREDPEEIGRSVMISSWERISERCMSPKVKMGANYMNSRLAQMEAKMNGYDTSIFLNNRGTVSEGPGSCVFAVINGVVYTPPMTSSILNSITRKAMIHLMREEMLLEVVEREIDRSELYLADEVFFVGTAVEVIHAKSIDKISIGDGSIGKVTKILKELYLDVCRNKHTKYANWLTPVY